MVVVVLDDASSDPKIAIITMMAIRPKKDPDVDDERDLRPLYEYERPEEEREDDERDDEEDDRRPDDEEEDRVVLLDDFRLVRRVVVKLAVRKDVVTVPFELEERVRDPHGDLVRKETEEIPPFFL